MLRNSRGPRDQLDQFISPVHWLDGADPNFLDVGVLQQRTQHLDESLPRRQVATPPPKVDSAENNFLVARIHQSIGFCNDAVQFHGAALAAHTGDDAERTPVVTSILYFQVWSRFSGDFIRPKHRRSHQLGVSKDVTYQ